MIEYARVALFVAIGGLLVFCSTIYLNFYFSIWGANGQQLRAEIKAIIPEIRETKFTEWGKFWKFWFAIALLMILTLIAVAIFLLYAFCVWAIGYWFLK